MSYTTLFIVPHKQQLKPFKNYQNSYGSAYVAWSYLWDKYVKQNERDYMHGDSQYEKLWSLYTDSRLKDCERIVLSTTFDHYIFKNKDREFLSKMFFEFNYLYIEKYPNQITHWPQIARDILKIPESDYGFCFRWTSVTDMWTVYKKNDSRYYKLSDKKHFIYKIKNAIAGKTQ